MCKAVWQAALVVALASLAARAQVIADGSLATSVNQIGGTFNITGGTRLGGNRFHSFSSFSVAAGQAAVFKNDPGVTRILARVTGGAVSTIHGTLRSETAGASLLLLNPAGIVFGNGAAIDVPGSFVATTADFVRFADSTRFDAAPGPNDSTLSAAAPESFGFLAASPAAIEVGDGAVLQLNDEHSLALVGGGVAIDDAQLRVADGAILLQGVNSPDTVPVDLDQLATVGRGDVAIGNGSVVSADGRGAGRIEIRGGRLTVSDSSVGVSATGNDPVSPGRMFFVAMEELAITDGALVRTLTAGDTDGAAMGLTSLGAVRITGLNAPSQPTTVGSATSGPARAGNVAIVAVESITMEGQVGITSATSADGDTGNLSLVAPDMTIQSLGDNDASVTLATNIAASGRTGDLVLDARTLTLRNATVSNVTLGAGNAGDMRVTADRVGLFDGASIFAATLSDAAGGNLVMRVDRLALRGASAIGALADGDGSPGQMAIEARRIRLAGANTRIGSPADGFDTSVSGDIGLRAEVLQLSDGAAILSNNRRAVAAGAVFLELGRLVIDSGGAIGAQTLADGAASGVIIAADDIRMSGGARITSATLGAGDAGAVVIDARSLQLTGDAQIDASTLAAGNGGLVSLIGGDIVLDGPDVRVAAITGEASTGRGGGVTIDARRLHMRRGASLGATSFGSGDAGVIVIEARDEVVLANTRRDVQTTIASQSVNDGAAGGVILVTGDYRATGRSGIFVDSLTDDRAGNIAVTARRIAMAGSTINSSALGAGDSGRILVATSGLLQLTDRASIRARTFPFSPANAGRIRIVAGAMTVADSDITVRSDNADSGNLIVRVSGPISIARSLISTEAARDGGNILLQSPEGIFISSSSILAQAGGNGGRILLNTLFRPSGSDASSPAATPAAVGNDTLLGPGPVTINDSLINGLASGQDVEVRIIATPLVLSSDSLILTGNAFFVPTDLSGEIAGLRGAELNRQIDLQDACRALLVGEVSTLTLTGRGSAAVTPADWSAPPGAP